MKWATISLALFVTATGSGCWRPYYGQTYAQPAYPQAPAYQQLPAFQPTPVYQALSRRTGVYPDTPGVPVDACLSSLSRRAVRGGLSASDSLSARDSLSANDGLPTGLSAGALRAAKLLARRLPAGFM